MVALNLRNANGSHFNPTTYAQFKTWILNATATNMAYMLSAQLAAMKLNVLNGFVDGAAVIYAPGTNSANAAGFAKVSDVIAEADAELPCTATPSAAALCAPISECSRTRSMTGTTTSRSSSRGRPPAPAHRFHKPVRGRALSASRALRRAGRRSAPRAAGASDARSVFARLPGRRAAVRVTARVWFFWRGGRWWLGALALAALVAARCDRAGRRDDRARPAAAEEVHEGARRRHATPACASATSARSVPGRTTSLAGYAVPKGRVCARRASSSSARPEPVLIDKQGRVSLDTALAAFDTGIADMPGGEARSRARSASSATRRFVLGALQAQAEKLSKAAARRCSTRSPPRRPTRSRSRSTTRRRRGSIRVRSPSRPPGRRRAGDGDHGRRRHRRRADHRARAHPQRPQGHALARLRAAAPDHDLVPGDRQDRQGKEASTPTSPTATCRRARRRRATSS